MKVYLVWASMFFNIEYSMEINVYDPHPTDLGNKEAYYSTQRSWDKCMEYVKANPNKYMCIMQ